MAGIPIPSLTLQGGAAAPSGTAPTYFGSVNQGPTGKVWIFLGFIAVVVAVTVIGVKK